LQEEPHYDLILTSETVAYLDLTPRRSVLRCAVEAAMA
jgi:hypothetical protein